MKEKLPLLVRVSIPPEKFDPDAVDAEFYCVNTTPDSFSILTVSESFTTIDEETGASAEHGSGPEQLVLAPGESKKIAEIRGWEWDGHVGIHILFGNIRTKKKTKKQYDFKHSSADFSILSSGLHGRIIPPLK